MIPPLPPPPPQKKNVSGDVFAAVAVFVAYKLAIIINAVLNKGIFKISFVARRCTFSTRFSKPMDCGDHTWVA